MPAVRLPVPFLLAALLLTPGACADDPADPLGAARSPAAASARGPTDPLSKVNQLPPSLERKVQALRADLAAQGYEVARGYWTLFTVEDCRHAIRVVGNCYGNNPTAPYILPAVPSWKDEYVDRALHLAVKPLQRSMSATYRLDEREALVVLALLPPPGSYFGIQSYVFSREGAIDEGDPIYRRLATMPDVRDLLFALTPNPSRVMTFASIGNSINDVVVHEASGGSFGRERFFVVTPDAVMERAVADALLRAGVPDRSHVFTEPVFTVSASSPGKTVRVGLDAGADDMMTVVRYALPQDSAAGALWREQLPLAVLRVRDRRTDRATEPYALQDYEPRAAIPDLAYKAELEGLVEAVKARWGQPEAVDTAFFSAFTAVDLVGQHCLQRRMNCLGDTQDNDTYRISRGVHLDDGEVIAVVGRLATSTGNATYVSLAVNRWEVLTGVANLTQEQLAGSAAAYAGVVGDTDDYFVYYVSRDCTGLAHCLELPETVFPRGETMKLMQRNYMVPGTHRGADAPKLLNPWLVILDGADRP